MPFVSKAQQRWGNSPAGKAALGGQSAVDEWNGATDESSLPETKKKKAIRYPGAMGKAKSIANAGHGAE